MLQHAVGMRVAMVSEDPARTEKHNLLDHTSQIL